MIQASIIIPTRNRAHLLDGTLASLALQSVPMEQYEVIVIDNGSTDNTAEVCQRWVPQFASMRIYSDPRPGLHVGRHVGLREARASILLYVDDDIKAVPGWLAAMLEAFADPKVGLVGGNNFPDFEVPPPSWLDVMKDQLPQGWAIPWLSILDFGNYRGPVAPQHVWGCNFGIRSATLLDVGGFHPDGMPDDLQHLRGDGESWVAVEAARRGIGIHFHPGASVKHHVARGRLTREYFAKRARASGVSWVFKEVRAAGGLTLAWRLRVALAIARSFIRAADVRKPRLRRALAREYGRGIAGHAARCRQEPELVRWISRPSFLEA